MAKTTSQIIKENKEREKAVDHIVSAMKARDVANHETIEKNRARTLDVLEKAISKTSDSTKRSDLERAHKSVSGSKPKTALDMQKKKEDRLAEKNPVDSLQIKKDRAQKNLDDYEEKTDFDATDTNARKQFDMEIDRLKREVSKVDAEIDQRTMQRDLETIESMTDEDRAAFDKYVRGGTYVNAEDIEAHKGLKSRYDDLDLLKESYEKNRNEEKVRQVMEETAQKVQDGGWIANAARSLVAVPANIIGGLTGSAGRVNELFNRSGRYSTLSPYTAGDIPTVYGQTVQSEVTGKILDGQEMNLTDGISGREIAAMAYQGGNSLLEIAGRIVLGLCLGNPAMAAGLAATQSFANSMTEATKQGATPAQAVILSVGKAGLEAATEKIPLDDLFDIAKNGLKSGGWKMLKQVFAQAGTEITEEEISLFGGLLMEAAVLREKSSYKQNIGDLVAGGMSYEEAREQADKSVWNEALQTAAVSGFSGALSAGGAEYVNARFVGTPVDVTEQAPGTVPAADNSSEMTTEVPQEIPAETVLTAPATKETADFIAATAQQQAQMVPAEVKEPMPEGLQHFDNAAAIANGMMQDESTSVNTDPAQHTPQEQAVIDEYQNSVDDNLVDYVEAVKNNPGQKMPRYPLKDVSDRAAADIQRLTGIDVTGNKTQIESRMIEHIIKDHGDAGATDRSMRDVNDIARIQYVIDNYDSMEHGGTSSAYVYQNKHGRNANAQTVVIKKKVNGTYFVVEAVPDTKKKTLYIVSAYMSKNGQKETASSLSGDAEASRVTSDNATKIDTVPNISIPENGTEVNGNIDENGAQDADTQGQSPEGGQVKGTGAAERNFSGVAEYENMLYDGNIQRSRPGAVRDVEIPKKDSDGRHVTELAGNATSSGVTPDRMADAIKSLVGDKKLSFDTRTNKQSLENAASDIRTRGEETVKSELGDHAKNGIIADGDVEKALVLYAKYANDPEYQDTASEVFINMAAVANMSGRNLQLFSLMKRMTPEGQLSTVRKDVQRSIDQINKGRSGRKQITYIPGEKNLEAARGVAQKRNVQITESLEQAFLDAKTDEQRQTALDDIYKNVAVQIKPTLGEAWDAWRNLAMLGNFKTHERNFFSTGAFKPYTAVKRTIGAALEKVFVEQDKRTKSVLGVGKEANALLSWAKADAKSDTVKDLLGGAGTAGDETRSAIQDYRKILPGPLDSVRKKNLDLMEKEDSFFKRGEYARSLAGFLKARGYTAEQLQNKQVPRGTLDEARQYAIKEAQKATFNDRNEFTDKITKLSKEIDNLGTGASIVRKGILPFVKTPANVVKRVMEYNPISMAKTLITAKGDIDSGRKSAADVVDEISAGLTGTAAMALGAALAAGMVPGVELIGSLDDEDEAREGAMEYSIGIGGKYYSIAWLAPAMIPLFIGANLYQTVSNWDGDADGWDLAKAILYDTTIEAINPMLELSMLSSLNDFVDNISNEETAGDKVMAAFVGAASSYFIQGIPTIAGQFEQATEESKNSTYVNTDNELEKAVKKTLADATKRIPGVDLYQTQKFDEWGRPVEHEGDSTVRWMNAVFNPFTTSDRKTDEVTKEITRLNKIQENDVTPPYVAKAVTYTDKDGNIHKDQRLNAEQYETMQRVQGETALRIISDMIGSRDYKALTDEQKAKAIQQAYSYARETAEIAAIGDMHTGYGDAWMMEMDKGKESQYILRRVAGGELSGAMSALDTAWDKGYDTESRSNDLKWAYDAFKAMTPQAQDEVREWATGTTAKYIEARESGVSHDDFLSAAEAVATVTGTGAINEDTGEPGIRDIDRREAIATAPGLSDSVRDKIMKSYMPDYDPDADSKNYTELKYNYIRQKLDLSPAQYAETYRVELDTTGGEDPYVAKVVSMGYSETVARKLYAIFNSTKAGKAMYMTMAE